MTYYQKDWDLYVANILMKETIKDSIGEIINESYYISIELFQFENPEEAYIEINKLIQSGVYSDAYRDNDKIIELKCIRLDELDLLQTNLDNIKSDLKNKRSYGVNISYVSINKFDELIIPSAKSKEELRLFDKFYNYKKDNSR